MRSRLPLSPRCRFRPQTALALLLGSCALFYPTTDAKAQNFYTANLTHDQETTQGTLLTSGGAPRALSFGTATFVLSADLTSLTMSVTIFNIDVTTNQTPGDSNDNLGNAHIHGGAGPGVNAGVVWGFFGAPDNDIAPDNLVVTPFANGVGGTFTSVWNQNEGNGGQTLTSQLNNLRNGLTYINFHTTQFTGGEIRGQIIAAAPEPGTLGLLGVAGLALLPVAQRLRRR